VRLDRGGSVAVVQEVSKNSPNYFKVGDRVRVLSSANGNMRVSY
jgi:outer membrane lipoprotein SlyB